MNSEQRDQPEVESHFAALRREMVESQLAARGIGSQKVLAAMGRIPREHFVPTSLQDRAYEDCALPIDCDQTISQPYIVALMTDALELTGSEKVLEIGTGSGYQAAVLAELVTDVVTLERHSDLTIDAVQRLSSLGYKNIEFAVNDGTAGWPKRAPYDRIIVTAAADEVPPKLFAQLREGGLMVIPLKQGATQVLTQIRKVEGRPQAKALCQCAFVPLVGATAED